MMFDLTIRADNAAFDPDHEESGPAPELARILRQTADRIESGQDIAQYLTIFDANGNDVGRFALKTDEYLAASRG